MVKDLFKEITKDNGEYAANLTIGLLRSLIKDILPADCQWVFPTQSRAGHMTNTNPFCEQIAEHGVMVYPHLLRKTYTTIAATCIPGAMVDCLTGHVPNGVTGKHYTFPSIGQLRPHTEKVTAKILRYAAGDFDETE